MKRPLQTLRRARWVLLLVMIGFAGANWRPILRYYALHAPVWGARGERKPASEMAGRIVAGARAQIGTTYDSDYAPIAYPLGDIDPSRGACSDVVVRALRHAGFDLQRLIQEDITMSPDIYRQQAHFNQADPNIDHRRALNQMVFLSRHGAKLSNELSPEVLQQWQPGDLVYWEMSGARQHTGVVSDRVDASGLPLVIHNGGVCIEQSCLRRWPIIGHFRFPLTEVERLTSKKAQVVGSR